MPRDPKAYLWDIREAIGLRNILVHGYATVNNALVWRTACNDVPVLRNRVVQLLDESTESD